MEDCSFGASSLGPDAHITVSGVRAALQLPVFISLALHLRDRSFANQRSGFRLTSIGSVICVFVLLASVHMCVGPLPSSTFF